MMWQPDGGPEDPRTVVRRIQAECPDWVTWWGPKTGQFWAITRNGDPLLVEAPTPGDLVARMRWVNTARRASAQRR
jgi:hypothetical protein